MIHGLMRFLVRRRRFLSRFRASMCNALQRLKKGQRHMNDLFGGNYLFVLPSPTPFRCAENSHMSHALPSTYSLGRNSLKVETTWGRNPIWKGRSRIRSNSSPRQFWPQVFIHLNSPDPITTNQHVHLLLPSSSLNFLERIIKKRKMQVAYLMTKMIGSFLSLLNMPQKDLNQLLRRSHSAFLIELYTARIFNEIT